MKPLSWWEKGGYALGDMGSNLYWRTFEVFIFFYYTDVFGLSAATLGWMLLLTRAGDAFADPLMGVIADRTKSRFGKFRPYLLWFGVPMAISGVLAFTVPNLGPSGRVVYAFVTYMLMMLVYTAVNIPYSALMGVMTPSSEQRTSLSTFRFYGAFIGGLFVQTFALTFVKIFGGGDAARGWQLTMVLFGVLAVLMFTGTFLTVTERVTPPKDQNPDLRRDLRDLLANRPWKVLFFVGLLVVASFFLRGGAAAYYFKYFIEQDDISILSHTAYAFRLPALGVFFGAGAFAGIAGVALTGPLTRRFGKRRLYCGLMVIGAVLTATMFFIPKDALWLAILQQVLVSFALGPQAPVLWAMVADTADYSEWKTSRRSTGLVFAALLLALKLGGAVGGLLLGVLLSGFGYVANASQSAATLVGIRLIISVFPGVLFLLAGAMVFLYELDEPTVKRVESELARRRARCDSAEDHPPMDQLAVLGN